MNKKQVKQVKFDGDWYEVLKIERKILPGIGYERNYIVSDMDDDKISHVLHGGLIEAVRYNDGYIEKRHL